MTGRNFTIGLLAGLLVVMFGGMVTRTIGLTRAA